MGKIPHNGKKHPTGPNLAKVHILCSTDEDPQILYKTPQSTLAMVICYFFFFFLEIYKFAICYFSWQFISSVMIYNTGFIFHKIGKHQCSKITQNIRNRKLSVWNDYSHDTLIDNTTGKIEPRHLSREAVHESLCHGGILKIHGLYSLASE